MRCRNKASCLLWEAASALLSGFSFSLNFSRCYPSLLRTCSKSKDVFQAHQSLLQPRSLLERHRCHRKNSGSCRSCRSPWRNSQAVAYQTSSLEDLLPAPHYVSRPKVDVSKPFDVSMYWGPSISGTRKSLRFNKTTDFYPTSLLINCDCLTEPLINFSKKTISLLTARVIFNFRNYYKEVPQAYFPANYKME